MANYTTSQDLVNDVLFRAGEPTDGTSDFDAQALQYLNRAYQAIWSGGAEIDPDINEVWWWLKKDPPGTITLEKEIDTGTVNVTNDSATITFSSAPAASVKDFHFKTDLGADVYRISAHTAAETGATLDSVYTASTDTVAAYSLRKLEYDLASDILSIVSPFRTYQDNRHRIEKISLSELDNIWPLRISYTGIPDVYAHVTETRIRFNRYIPSGSDRVRTDYDYMFEPSDLTDSGSDIPVIPRQYRRLLSDIALTWIYADKNDDRRGEVGQAARSLLKAMSIEHRARMTRATDDFGRIQPRGGPKSARRTGPLRTESGLIIG